MTSALRDSLAEDGVVAGHHDGERLEAQARPVHLGVQTARSADKRADRVQHLLVGNNERCWMGPSFEHDLTAMVQRRYDAQHRYADAKDMPHREVVAGVIRVQRQGQQVVRRIVEGVPGAQHLAAARDQNAVDQLEPAAHVLGSKRGPAFSSVGRQTHACNGQRHRHIWHERQGLQLNQDFAVLPQGATEDARCETPPAGVHLRLSSCLGRSYWIGTALAPADCMRPRATHQQAHQRPQRYSREDHCQETQISRLLASPARQQVRLPMRTSERGHDGMQRTSTNFTYDAAIYE